MNEFNFSLALVGCVAALAAWTWRSLPRPPVRPQDRLESVRAPRVLTMCLIFLVLLLIGHALF